MVGCSIFFFVIIMKDDLVMGAIFGIFMLITGIFLAYMVIAVGILKSYYIEMTSEYIKVSLPFKSKVAYWSEINSTEAYEYKNNIFIAILLKKDRLKRRKRSISNSFNSISGIPSYSFQIPLRLYKDIEVERLLLTIENQINQTGIENEAEIVNSNEDYEEPINNIIKAIIASIMMCIVTSVVYGLSIYKLEKNYIVIPIFACFLIISAFNKYYLEESFSVFIRILVGMICFIQVPISIIGSIIISQGFSFTANDIYSVTVDYFKYLIDNPLDQISIIVVAIICFGIGVVRGRLKSDKGDMSI